MHCLKTQPKIVIHNEAKVLPSTRKFTEMGVSPKKPLEPLEQIEKGARALTPQEKN